MLVKIQTNVDKYFFYFSKISEQIFQKKTLKNTTNISNIKKYVENPNPNRRFSFFVLFAYLSFNNYNYS